MAKLVRLRPYDPKRGHVLRRYTAFGIRFDETRGWYRVSDEVASYLSAVREQPGLDYTPLAFDVCSEDEAQALEAREKKEREERAVASAPNVATAFDVSAKTMGPDLNTAELPKSGRSSRRA